MIATIVFSGCTSPSSVTLSSNSFHQWTHVGGEATYSWDGETLTAQGVAQRNGFLVSPLPFADFELNLEVKITRGNSGVQFRSRVDREANRVVGYQMEVDPTERGWSGGIYEEGLRGWIAPLTSEQVAKLTFKVGEWNTYRILCRGDHIQTWINGDKVTDMHDGTALRGIVALQTHAGDSFIEWRGVTIRSTHE
ncbi:MAG: DUF1080 domain-containing protein [Planctomycetota bacterium]|nr:DUF1080 domain-containing protein [Planctomycetota bacterium]